MVLLKFVVYVLVLFLCCVHGSDVKDKIIDKTVSNADLKRRSIHYSNRPPSAVETYSIPVAVVIGDEIRKDKSVDLVVSDKVNNESVKENGLKISTEKINSQNKMKTSASSEDRVKDDSTIKPKGETVNVKDNKTPDVIKIITGTETVNKEPISKQETSRDDEESKTIDKSGDKTVNAKDITTPDRAKASKVNESSNTNTKSILNKGSELQIPVAVIYDEPKVIVNNEKPNRSRQSKRIEKSNTNRLITEPRTVENKLNKTVTIASRDPRDKIQVPILQSENFVFAHNGEFRYSYEGGDGTKASESGKLKSIDDENTGEAVVGSFSYVGQDGNDYSLTYTADENGYRPVGAHLPTPPPIPPAIARALKYLATKTTPEPVTKSSN